MGAYHQRVEVGEAQTEFYVPRLIFKSCPSAAATHSQVFPRLGNIRVFFNLGPFSSDDLIFFLAWAATVALAAHVKVYQKRSSHCCTR